MKTPLLMLMAALAGAQPAIQNAQIEKLNAAASLARQVEQLARAAAGPMWIGYAVPAVRDTQGCCYSGDASRGCFLETARAGVQPPAGVVRLEGSHTLHVLLRAENQQVGKVRTYSGDCPLDAGGLRFVWLEGVQPDASVGLLKQLSGVDANPVIAAIAMHATPAADAALKEYTSPGQPEKNRRQAAFWLGSARGATGLELLDELLRQETSMPVLESAIHALSVSREPKAVDRLIEAARRDSRERVRSKALFWLAQKAGKSQAGILAEAVEQDPATEVKKNAVFAISQLPKQEGVPLLIRVARTNSNPAVRKQAIFWLGQSGDQQALQFFEEILKR